MTKTVRQNKVKPESCRECSHWSEIREKIRVSELLTKAMTGIEERFKEKDYKPSVGDFLKLLQMEQELEQDAPKEIKVTWVEPLVTSDSEK